MQPVAFHADGYVRLKRPKANDCRVRSLLGIDEVEGTAIVGHCRIDRTLLVQISVKGNFTASDCCPTAVDYDASYLLTEGDAAKWHEGRA